MKTTPLILTLIATIILVSSAAIAAPEKAIKSTSDELTKAVQALVKDQSEMNKNHFGALYHTHNLIDAVKTVRHDIDQAIKACADKNQDMAEKMTTRYAAWEAAVNPVLADAQTQVDNMTLAQSYAQPEDIKHILALSTQLRDQSAQEITKVPVSTPEACETLYNTLDDTQGNLVNMLRETLISIPHQLQKQTQAADKES